MVVVVVVMFDSFKLFLFYSTRVELVDHAFDGVYQMKMLSILTELCSYLLFIFNNYYQHNTLSIQIPSKRTDEKQQIMHQNKKFLQTATSTISNGIKTRRNLQNNQIIHCFKGSVSINKNQKMNVKMRQMDVFQGIIERIGIISSNA